MTSDACRATLAFAVTASDTALFVGSGDVSVLATPRLIAWIEAATVAVPDLVGPGQASVGTRVDIEHLAATPIGASVQVTADVVHRDGRLVRFAVAAHHDAGDGPVLVAQGQVTRVIVDRARFEDRAARDLIIRPAIPDEWPAVGDLCVLSYSTGYGLSGDADDYVVFLRDVAGRASMGEVLVAVADGALVGTVMVIPGGSAIAETARPGEVEFRFMAVAPAAWRRGIGRALVSAVIARAGNRPVACSTIEGNEPAVALYASVGFEPVPDRDSSPVPGVVLHAFVRSPQPRP